MQIDEKDPQEQADFWTSCVGRKQPELDQIGGLPLDSIVNDVLTRYFDSSARGIDLVFKAALRDQSRKGKDALDKDGLYDAFSEHFHFYDIILDKSQREAMLESGSNEHFGRVCEVVGIPCSQQSFAYATRRLRIAMLLKYFQCDQKHHSKHHSGKVYHCDYDDDFIHTPFVLHKERRTVFHDMKAYSVPVIEEQVAIDDYARYLFTSKMNRPGRVHWTHMHFPSTDLLLAVGQVWRLPGPALGMMCELRKAQPQVSYLDPTKPSEDEDRQGYSWSYVVMPAVYLDHISRRNLDLYRQWFERMQDPELRKTVDPEPPRVHVACTHMTLGMMWSSSEANTLVSAETEPYYIGKWTTDTSVHTKSFLSVWLNRLTCAGCCLKRKASDARGDYHKLATEDPVEEGGVRHFHSGIEIGHDLHEELHTEDEECIPGQKATDSEKSCISFEKTFDQVLQTLERQNSMLRLGDHWHLLTRIMLNRSAEYLDVLEVYEAAIVRLGYLLHDPETSNKDSLVGKIETTILQLNNLERLVHPFAHYVVPDLVDLAEKLHFDYPLVFHHVKDIQNNVRCFVPKCTSLISLCKNLTTEYDRIAGDRMNNILNILTFITFVITPMQLMTGLYGMNFRIMPELNWKHGYHYFWALSLTLTITFALILVCLKRR